MTRCLLGIGSNLGDRAAQMDAALVRLRQHERIDVLADSGWEETAPVGGPQKQLSYLNGAILVDTALEPSELLEELLQVERTLGRERDLRWGPRSVDLDLLLFGEEIVDQPGLTVPHPWMAVRRFVLDPAGIVAPDMIHPVIGWSLGRLAENLRALPLVIAIRGMTTEAIVCAVHKAAKDCDAYIASAASTNSSVLVSESSAVSAAAESLELPRAHWAATEREIRNARKEDGGRVILFDDAWRATRTVEATAAAEQPIQPNLLIQLTDGNEQDEFDGPTLFLDTDDHDRLQHDVTAAIQGMQ